MRYNINLLALTKRHVVKRKQFLLYACIGLSGVLIDYLFYAIGLNLLGLGILLANFISISLGIVNNFILNTKFNFKVKDQLFVRFALFYTVGFLGLLLSESLLIVFHYGFNISPLWAKLLTLLPVLLFQYFLNKTVSFGSLSEAKIKAKRWLFHWPAYILLVCFMLSSLLFVKFIPANFNLYSLAFGPDELAHYSFNVDFMLHNHRLPISGKDDVAAYENCRDNPSALVPCLYSYTFYPGASYVVNAVSAAIFSHGHHITPQMAARFPSAVYGGIFLLTLYASCYLITRRRLIATLITFGTAFIPQYIFVTSYTNLDAHSVAISGLLGLSVVWFWLSPHHKWTIPFLALCACGLLPLAKYNYFVLFLAALAAVIWHAYKRILSKQELLKLVLWSLGSFIVLSAFWYVRNTILYHDPLGQNFALQEMAKYHHLGEALPANLPTLSLLANMNFFSILYNSFYLSFGGMFYFLDSYKYVVPQILTAVSAIYVVYVAAESKRALRIIGASAIFLGFFLLTLGEVLYNSIQYDFQPQGRYMFPMLIVSAIYMAYLYRLDYKFALLSVLLASSTLYLFVNGAELFIKVYLHV